MLTNEDYPADAGMVSVGRLLREHLETPLSLEKLYFSLAVRAALWVRAGRACPHAAITLAALQPEPTHLFLGGGFHCSVLRVGIRV